MTLPLMKNGFVTGELSPDLSGRTDLEKYALAAATFRNGYVNYRGGFNSRAGTAFVGYSKQSLITAASAPPKLVPFQFSTQQGLVLEFGDNYMRVISDGAFVTEGALAITAITNANPGVISVSTSGAASATSNNGSVISSYNTGDTITLAGGTYNYPAVLNVNDTTLTAVQSKNPGTGFVPNDTVTLGGGVHPSAAVVSVTNTQLGALPGIVNAGSGGSDGTATLIGTTGTGTKFQVQATISGGAIASIDSILVGGAYTVNPTSLNNEPVTGAGLAGAILSVQMGVGAVTITTPGVYTSNAGGGNFSQLATSGSGVGATFWFGIFSPLSLSVASDGQYVTYPSNPVSQQSTSGQGRGATFNVSFMAGSTFASGDWVYLQGIQGPTALNGRTVILTQTGSNSYSMHDIFGAPIDTSAMPPYKGSGSASRIYTLPTPYAAVDLPYLKKAQSADVMSLCCWNQQTLSEYAPMELTRYADDNWTLLPLSTVPSTQAPSGVSGSPTAAPGAADGTYFIFYYVTAVNGQTGEESEPSQFCVVYNNYLGASNTSGVTASNLIFWNQVSGATLYNVYAETPVPTKANVDITVAGSPWPSNVPQPTYIAGLIGQTQTTSFTDGGIAPDFSTGLPQAQRPFAPGQIIGGTIVASGSGYYVVNANYSTATVNTSTGDGAQVLSGVFVPYHNVGSLVIVDPGEFYSPNDTVTINGTGSGASAILQIGPESGTYPGVVAYFQQRRVYANSPNNTDTYWMSQPGLYTNFNVSFPTIASDAITGSPWATEVNGIQWMIDMPGGLVVLTGSSAWQLTGAGGSSLNPVPISPQSQQAQPQAYNGVSPTIEPIKIDWQILYVQAKGALVREFTYQIYQNIYTGIDLTELSSHLFNDYQIVAWDYAEEPYKIIWTVRDDGVMLSCTYLKAESVWGWGRHDTQGQYVSVCSITELPVDAVYVATRRFPTSTEFVGVYMIERMDDRFWNSAEDVFAVDAGLSLAQNYPNAAIFASSPTGLGAVSLDSIVSGGTNYSAATIIEIIDDDGEGSGTGAAATLTINNGVIVGVTFSNAGTGYINPAVVISDPAGSDGGNGAEISLFLLNTMTFLASSGVFSAESVGSFLRMGGGIAEIVAYSSSTIVTGNILTPITATQNGQAIPQPAGSWTLDPFVTQVGGLYHLAGFEVTGLGDGNVMPPQIVPSSGTISLAGLPNGGASVVNVGLSYTAQVQSVNADGDQPTIQGRRKAIKAVTGRVVASRGLQTGQNQPNGSDQSPIQVAPAWQNMDTVPDKGQPAFNALCTPLYTGDVRVPLQGGYGLPGQAAFEQTQPLPMNINSFMLEIDEGDTPQVGEPRTQGNQLGGGRQ